MIPISFRWASVVGAGLCLLVPQVEAVLFYDAADASHNTTAPGGAYADSGWQYQGLFGNFLGTAISSSHFITARHIGLAGLSSLGSATFVQSSLFTGEADVTYTLNTEYQGIGYYDVPGTDLRIYQINGTFPEWAELYSGGSETGSELVVTGRGAPKGAEVRDPVTDELKGWLHGSAVGTTRWGVNEVTAIAEGGDGIGELLAVEFNALPGMDEAHLSTRDSGGAVFIQEGGVWKLAGINYAVDSPWDWDADHTSGLFNAALFDAGGLYTGPADDPGSSSWRLIEDAATDAPSRFYASRISTHLAAIQAAIAPIPEPSALAWLGWGLVVMTRRRPAG